MTANSQGHDPIQPPDSDLLLTFVFPCLNEELTLGKCIEKVRSSLTAASCAHEIIVADNGSTDRSRAIANALGCRVVPVEIRGYGAALRAGIEAARSPYVAFADSDDTYLYHDVARLYRAAKEANAGMAVASRMMGEIATGSMPLLHRYIGTPVLTTLINLLFTGRLTDCNSGFRCIRKAEYETWNIRSNGMEFASELLIKALKVGTKTVEISSGLNCGPPGRKVHLRTWRDGMRHLLFILSEKPALFERSGLALALLATLLQTAALIAGPVAIAGINFLDLHTQVLLLLAGFIGAQFYVFSCCLFLVSGDKPMPLTRWLIHLDEGVLFFGLLSTLTCCSLTVASIFWLWVSSGFAGLHQAHSLVGAAHFLGLALTSAVGLLSVHTLKKSR